MTNQCVRALLLFCLGALLFPSYTPVQAQETELPPITSENVQQLALYMEFGPGVFFQFVPESSRVLIQRPSETLAEAQTEVWDVVSRELVAILDTYQGALSADYHYMLVYEPEGFSIWDMQAYEMRYRLSGAFKRDISLNPMIIHSTYFQIVDNLAYVTGSQIIHVIDLDKGQEIDRTLLWCTMPEEIRVPIQATCEDCPEGWSSNQTSGADDVLCKDETVRPTYKPGFIWWSSVDLSANDRLYEERNLRINYGTTETDYLTTITTYYEDYSDEKGQLLVVWPTREALSLDIAGKFIVTQHTLLNSGREAVWQLYAVYACRMTALNENIGLYQGPNKRQLLGTFGKFYDAGTLIGVVGQSGEGWWKLATGEWIQRDLTTSDGACDALPEVTID